MDVIRLSTAFTLAYAACSQIIFMQSLFFFGAVLTPFVGLLTGVITFYFCYRKIEPLASPNDRWVWLLILFFTIYYLPLVLLPHSAEDDFIYHLTFVKSLLINNGLVHDPLLFNFDLAKLFEFPLLLLQFNNFQFAKLVNVIVALLLSLNIFQCVRTKFDGLTGFLTATAFLTFDVTYQLANSCYVELFLTLALFLAWFHYRRFLDNQNFGSLWLSCLLMSVAIATKISALLFLMPFITYEYLRNRNLYLSAKVFALALSLALPWIIRNAIIHHNPFFPLAGEIFPSPYVSVDRYLFYNTIFDMFSLAGNFWQSLFIPLRILGAGIEQERLLASMYTAAGLVAYIGYWQSRDKFSYFFVTPFLVAWLLKTHQVRFLLPIMLLGFVLLERRNRIILTILILGIVQGVISSFDSDKIRFLSRQINSEQYLTQKHPELMKFGKLLDTLTANKTILPDNQNKIYTIGFFYRGYLFSQPTTTNLYYDFEPILTAIKARDPDILQNFWNQNAITYLLIHNNYDDKVLRSSSGFDFDLYENYRSNVWQVIYEDEWNRIYKVR